MHLLPNYLNVNSVSVRVVGRGDDVLERFEDYRGRFGEGSDDGQVSSKFVNEYNLLSVKAS